MGHESKIGWTQSTWNPWHGCIKISPGCKYCYMYRDKERYGQNPMVVVRSKTTFYNPLKWKDARIIFTCSWSDWFIDLADDWRGETWELIKLTPRHTYQILTKRPSNFLTRLPDDWGQGYDNVWLGVSVEDLDRAFRVDILRTIPAKRRFLSIEPLLDKINDLDLTGIHWVIVGGESGSVEGKYRFRPCQYSWIERIIAICREQKVPVFVKQTGTDLARIWGLDDPHGAIKEEWPIGIQIQEMMPA